MKQIKIILADDNDNTRSSLKRLLELDDAIDIVSEARDGKEVIAQIPSMEPHIVLMDVNMPELNGIEATRVINRNYPQVAVILMSVNDETQNFRRAMSAGAKEYLVKPIPTTELHSAIHQVAEAHGQSLKRSAFTAPNGNVQPVIGKQKIISMFGTKGGVGKSLVCTNLAVAAAQAIHGRVGLMDLDFQFGDVCVMMNIEPRKTILELLQEGDQSGKEILEQFLYERYGVHVLAPPNKPELSELISAAGVARIMTLFREYCDYTFIDTSSYIDESTLTILENSDIILLVVGLDLPSIKDIKKAMDILRSLSLLPKARLILNRSKSVAGIEARDVEKALDLPIRLQLPSDGKLVMASVNQGVPFIKINPRAPISKEIINLFRMLEKEQV